MQSSKIIGSVVTVLVHALLLVLLIRVGYQRQVPPPAEQGILIAFGNETSGLDVEQARQQQEHTPQPPPPTQQGPEEVLSQDYEEAPVVAPKPKAKPKPQRTTPPKPTNPTPTQQPPATTQPEQPKREVNRAALFGSRTGTANSNPGTGQGTNPGPAGSPDGNPNATSPRGGLGDISGASLDGRSLTGTLPEPDYQVQKAGKLVVRIKVDRNGNVVEAIATQQGSTVWDDTLIKAAEQAARKAKFNANLSAPIYQTGTITYVFRLG